MSLESLPSSDYSNRAQLARIFAHQEPTPQPITPPGFPYIPPFEGPGHPTKRDPLQDPMPGLPGVDRRKRRIIPDRAPLN